MASNQIARLNRTPLLAHVGVWLYAAILIVPLLFVLLSSFKGNIEIFNEPFALPTVWKFDNYFLAWNQAGLGVALSNSIINTVAAEILVLVLALPSAYALARAKGRLGIVLERVFALGLLLPAFAALVPTVLLAVALQLFQTREFYILFLPATALPLSVILLTQFMRTIPPALEESALLDGASRFRILVSIYIPLARPGIATVAILNFLAFWNEYLFAVALIGPATEARTVQTALPKLVSSISTEFGVLLAGCVITMVPVFVVYIIFQRRVEGALLDGAVKN